MGITEEGLSQKEAVRLYRVSRAAIIKWRSIYRKKGIKGLHKQQQGRPKSSGKLEGWQAAWVVRTITETCPEPLKKPWVLWTREAIRQLINDTFKSELSISSVSRLLKKWGVTPQKPVWHAYQRTPKVNAQWMQKEYPKIHKQAQKEHAQIFWGDEMGVTSTDQVGRSFGRRGHPPVVQTSGSRYSCNMISAISNSGNGRCMIFKERFTIDVYLKFLRKLLYKQDRKLFLIVDNHRVHHAKKVHAWLEKYTDKIAVFYLPPYAPERNPDELLHHDVTANSFKRRRPRSENDLKNAVRSFMYATQKNPSKVSHYFKKPELNYIFSAA